MIDYDIICANHNQGKIVEIDDSSWTAGSVSVNGAPYQGWSSGNVSVGASPNFNGSIVSTPTANGSGAGITSKVTMNQLTLNPILKNDVRYVIIDEDGKCFELDPQPMITAREMIGLSMFINTVSVAFNVSGNVAFMWSELINTLGIKRHFSPGKSSLDMYDDGTNVLNIFLIDETI